MPRQKMNEEHVLQVQCVTWFKFSYPDLQKKILAIPNGGYRPKKVAAELKAEGVLAGVSDLMVMRACGGDHGLWIEMKTPKGRQSEAQKEFEKNATDEGYAYALCRTFDEFKKDCEEYLGKGRGVV